ncbi:MAG: Gfo/Idh/MocA family oxidoreductase [Acidobacteria bacterium]|jgi:predicted dehydrogenase|nr:Gfo/Idh/MocA family oxidoreductase [Acidobacteriota bacterium]
MLKVGVVGAGYIGLVHVETLMRMPGIEVAGVADTNEAQLAPVAATHPGLLVTSDYRKLLKDPDIAAIHNCTPNNVHFAVNQAALKAGKHLLSEKPLALTSDQAKKLLDLAEARGLKHAVHFCYRYYPTVQEIAARVRRGEIGPVREVLGHYLQDWLMHDTDYSWRLDPKVSGRSNTVADIGSHWFDLAQFLSASPIVEVMADLNTFVPRRRRPRGAVLTFAGKRKGRTEGVDVKVEDYASILLHFENGARGATTVSQVCAGRKCTIDVQVYGAKAALAWNHERPELLWQGERDRACEVLRENPLLQSPSTRRFARLPSGHPMGYFDAVMNLFSEFYAQVRGDRRPRGQAPAPPDFSVGLDQMRIVEAVLQSHRTKRWVKVKRPRG